MTSGLPISGTVLFIIFIVACIAFGIIWEIFRTKCPMCKKFFARKIDKIRSSASYSGGYNHTHKHSTNYCVCKYCGHEWSQHYTSTKHKK